MKGKCISYKAGIMLCLLISTSLSNAQPGIEWLLEGGPDWFNMSRTTISPTDIETDNLSRGHANTTGDLGLGVYYKQPLINNGSSWLNRFRVGLEVRYSGFLDNIVEGTVYQFEQTNLDNYRYNLYFENTRLLAQVALDILTYKQVSLYLKGGIGEGWSRLSYRDFPNMEELGGGLLLPRKNTSRFVSNIGVGFDYHHTDHFSYSLSYLYTNFGSITASRHGQLNNEAVTIHKPSFSIDSHALLVGIHYYLA